MEEDFQCNILSDNSQDDIILKNKQTNQLTIEIEQKISLAQQDSLTKNSKILDDEFGVDIISQDSWKSIPIIDPQMSNMNNQSGLKKQNQTCDFRQTIQQEQKKPDITNHYLEQQDEFSNFNIMPSIEPKKFSHKKIKQNILQKSKSNNNVIQQLKYIDSDNTDEVDSEDDQKNKPQNNNNQLKDEIQDKKQEDQIKSKEQKQAWLLKNKRKIHENQVDKKDNEIWDFLEIVKDEPNQPNLFEQGLFKRSDYGIQTTIEQLKQQKFKKELHKSDLKRLQLSSTLMIQEQKKNEILDSTFMELQAQNNNNGIEDFSDPKDLKQNFEVSNVFNKRVESQKVNPCVQKHIIKNTENNLIESLKIPQQLQASDQFQQIIKGSNMRTMHDHQSQKNLQNQPQQVLKKPKGNEINLIQQNQSIKQEKRDFIQKCDDPSIRRDKNVDKSLKLSGRDYSNNQKQQKQQEVKQSNMEQQLQKQQRQQERFKNNLQNLDAQQQYCSLTDREKGRMKNDIQSHTLDNLLGQRGIEELLNEDNNEFRSIKVEQKKTGESKRLSKFKMMLESNTGQSFQTGRPIFEFNRLLKYLFLKNYEIPDIADQEQKIIPNRFESALEYCKIFEYLFLNEACAQMKQELIEFLKKIEKTTKYRKAQIKIDENDHESEGSIFVMRGPQTIQQKVPQAKNKQQTELEGNDQGYQEDQLFCYDNIKDGVCDLTTHKNFVVLITNKLKLKLRQINQLQGENMCFFGILIDPQKAQYLQQIRIQTFVNKQNFNVNQWHNVFLFPFSKLTTLIREYQMITKLNQKTPLAGLIYNPSTQQQQIGSDIVGNGTDQFKNQIQNKDLLDSFFQLVDEKYNKSQANSIREIILKEKGICLVQGPPGTGKTHLLLGLLSGAYEYMKLTNKFPKKKILICTPSNAAIDEIILRIVQKGGLFDSKGNSRQANLIRIGLLDEENIHSEIIKKVSLEDLAQHKLFSSKKFNAEQDQKTTAELRIELCQIQTHVKKLEKKLTQHGLPSDERKIIKEQIMQFNDLRKTKQEYLEKTKDSKRFHKEFYNQFCEKLLNDAEIIFSTLSSSGSDKLSKYLDQIELLIVDEAAQCTEPSNIIPLRLGIKKMILIGDPKQLPATTFSPVSHQTLYNRSLFERILDNNVKPYFLDIQYRMHSEIRMFPSEYFYQNKLKDHESTNTRNLPSKFFKNRVLFLDILDGQEQKDGTSNINEQEAIVIVQLIKSIKEEFPTQTIGVICAYKSQVRYIKTLLKQKFQDENIFDENTISINTVDSFQGQEEDIILFSCVRSSQTGGIGFLNDGRRMNVALTRAKNALFILGNAITLSKSNLWRSMLKNIQQRKLYRRIESYNFQFEQILKDQWNQNNKTLSQKLIWYLNQTSQGNHEKSTYTISDFQIEVTGNQKTNPNQNQKIIKDTTQDVKNQQESSISYDHNYGVDCKEKERSTSEYQMSKLDIRNQKSHNIQHQIKNSNNINNKFHISKDKKVQQKRKVQADVQWQKNEYPNQEDFDIIKSLDFF
ncbi:unnamed protein product (macronuclear) [Paramecium tetraurelia]|uniref:UvrD-like helicase ATP-binding domain-containing protein n=1 Tax=Paramecium tetraurelia TaxID=5888 RepID=A0CR93_PARTE|nr:uncharacterized protein GSPATT00009625001 [Paramecium tetraurelia]CAK73310.1 unnamed protein product [Paramecium tetraurelia]|eukprot:XP_001440707.1 hypothetical protein (macronuclear) [Paramecium tetraurelia strain d4-2]